MSLFERLIEALGGGSGFVGPFASSEGVPEIPNWVTVIIHYVHGTSLAEFLHHWEGMIFAYLIAGLIILAAHLATRNPTMIPGRLQNLVEMVTEGLSNFLMGILGPQGKEFVPFLGTLFIYILCMNLSGVVPLSKSPTSSPNTTVALALCVFSTSSSRASGKTASEGTSCTCWGHPRARWNGCSFP